MIHKAKQEGKEVAGQIKNNNVNKKCQIMRISAAPLRLPLSQVR